MLYLIAHNLCGPQKAAVDALRGTIAARFGVKAALRLPPHLTLFYPFEAPKSAGLEASLAALASRLRPFTVATTGFAAFDGRVWFIDVDQARALRELKRKIASAVWSSLHLREKTHTHSGVHFHVTLAAKDVSPDAFRGIEAFLAAQSTPLQAITVDSFTLLRHYGNVWVPQATFRFGVV